MLLFSINMLMLSSCKEDNENEPSGPPVITNVRPITPEEAGTSLTQALPGSHIVIQGQNFFGVKEVYFNNMPASFNSALVSNNNLVILIPEDTPTEATDPTVSNTIRVVTTKGEASFNFILVPPPPIISSISNENALPGTQITINGSNLYLVQKVVFPGNIEVTNFTTSANGRTLGVAVPSNLSSSGKLTILTKYGSTTTVSDFNESTGPNILANFDGINFLEWGSETSSDAAKFPGAKGTFVYLNNTGVGPEDFSWWNNGRSLNLPGSTQWLPKAQLSGAISDYALKFEIFTEAPWDLGSIFIVKDYDWTHVARYEPWKVGNTTVPFNSNGWRTVTIPLTEFRTKANNKDGTGSSASSLPVLLGSEGKGSFNLFFVNEDLTKTVEKFQVAIDNIRIVKIK